MKILDTLYFDNIQEFACRISDKFDELNKDNDGLSDVSIIAKYEEATKIIKELLCIGYDICSLEINDQMYDGYCDEYIITLLDNKIFCKKFKRDNKYIKDESNATYISGDCNSACIDYVYGDEVFAFEIIDDECEFARALEIGISDDEYVCCDCESCDEDMHGFTAHRNDENGYSSISFYTTEKIDSDEMKDILEIFGL